MNFNGLLAESFFVVAAAITHIPICSARILTGQQMSVLAINSKFRQPKMLSNIYHSQIVLPLAFVRMMQKKMLDVYRNKCCRYFIIALECFSLNKFVPQVNIFGIE